MGSCVCDSTPLLKGSAQHITGLHTATTAFIFSKSSEKLRLALKKHVRNYKKFYDLGYEFYYKRTKLLPRKGPDKFLGQDGPVPLFTHGARYICKAHICKAQLTTPLEADNR